MFIILCFTFDIGYLLQVTYLYPIGLQLPLFLKVGLHNLRVRFLYAYRPIGGNNGSGNKAKAEEESWSERRQATTADNMNETMSDGNVVLLGPLMILIRK